ncbi:MAG: rhodanese-like domain-containing protein [Gammaproteobacteria bacterium]|nr:rhodanese-like domain-containing protein [Gammaproteobacteria bacterium]
MKHTVSMFLLLFISMSAKADVNNIDNVQLKSMLEAGVPVIDVRRAEEWKQTGIVKGSHMMTFFDKSGRYDVKSWLSKLDKVAKSNAPFILICRTGNRTGIISNFLDKKLSYTKVYNVERGITSWISKGNPTVKPTL